LVLVPQSFAASVADRPPGGAKARGVPGETRRWLRLKGLSRSVRQLEAAIDRVAAFDCPVLITGETGCGKEDVARAIHEAGPRRDRPFVAVNCGGLVATIAESQLFGHDKGAFTGAQGASRGAFRAAEGGVLFLDEIGEMPLELQPKLLRVLQRLEVTPVGATTPQTVDVQVITATNRDLDAEVEAGGFREDLLYRLNTIQLVVPPLRERPDDIPRFLEYFSTHFANLYGCEPWRPDDAMLEQLVAHHWPGNVRQLIQTIQRVYVFHDRADAVLAELLAGPAGTAGDAGVSAELASELPATMPAELAPAAAAEAAAAEVALAEVAPATIDPVLPVVNLDELRRLAVRQALTASDGHRGRAAQLLGVSLNTMTRLVAEACPGAVAKSGRRASGSPRRPR
jgi:DNA-binding NtrC family response regulator